MSLGMRASTASPGSRTVSRSQEPRDFCAIAEEEERRECGKRVLDLADECSGGALCGSGRFWECNAARVTRLDATDHTPQLRNQCRKKISVEKGG
eukprot:scaffold25061_cov65-Phaeocystis_antarctica.AAC.2